MPSKSLSMRTCEKSRHHLVASRNVLRMEKVSVETEDLHHVGEAIDLVRTHKLLAAGKVMVTFVPLSSWALGPQGTLSETREHRRDRN